MPKHPNCETCDYYGTNLKLDPLGRDGTCHAHAPTSYGFPVVAATDWCADHSEFWNDLEDVANPVEDSSYRPHRMYFGPHFLFPFGETACVLSRLAIESVTDA